MSKQHNKREARRMKILNNCKDRWNKINGNNSEISCEDNILVGNVPHLPELVYQQSSSHEKTHAFGVYEVVADEVLSTNHKNHNFSILLQWLKPWNIKHDLFINFLIAGCMNYVFVKWKSLYKIFILLYHIVFIMKEGKDLETKKNGSDRFKAFIICFGLAKNRIFSIFNDMIILSNFIRYQCSIYIVSLILMQKTFNIFISNYNFIFFNI